VQAQDAAVSVAQANIAAQQSQVARLEKLQSYSQVVAPFEWGHHPALDRHRQPGDGRQHGG